MRDNKISQGTVVILSLWLVVNLISAGLIQIYGDEAYYWVYSQKLDFGYFDHPPCTAILIKLGYAIFPNEIGARLPFILLNTITLYLIRKQCKNVSDTLFGLASFSILAFHILGFVAVPDAPLLFFAVLFLIYFERYLNEDSPLVWIGLVLGILGMLYSKYHGILIIIFCLIPHSKLLSRKSFYYILGVSLIGYLPHILWQFNHDLPSVQYHLMDRNSEWKIDYFFEYLFGQPAFYGLISGFLLFYYSILTKANTKFDRSLKSMIIGFFGLFLALSFRGRIEVNWTYPIAIPLMILALPVIQQKKRLLNWFYGFCILSILAGFGFRYHAYTPSFPKRSHIGKLFWKNKEFTEEVDSLTNGMPVIANSYQIASILSFYRPDSPIVHSLNLDSRSNQFDYWDFADNLEGKDVWFVNHHLDEGIPLKWNGIREEKLTLIKKFKNFSGYAIEPSDAQFNGNSCETIQVNLDYIWKSPKPRKTKTSAENTFLSYTLAKNSGGISQWLFHKEKVLLNALNNLEDQTIQIFLPEENGEYQISFILLTEGIGKWHVTQPYQLIVE
jgi:hypothetical protein